MTQANVVSPADRTDPMVVIERLVKRFGGFAALSDINLNVAREKRSCFADRQVQANRR